MTPRIKDTCTADIVTYTADIVTYTADIVTCFTFCVQFHIHIELELVAHSP